MNLHMKNQNLKLILKRILFIIIAIYIFYTFISQQKTLNAYKADENRYLEQIAVEEEKKAELNSTIENVNSKEYIEQIAREKLNMYLPNEKVYIDVSK